MDISAVVTGFYERDNAVFYELLVSSRSFGAQWKISKRYSHFAALFAALEPNFPMVPPLPPKTLLRTTDEDYLKYRQEQLGLFLAAVARRKELVLCEEVRQFLEVEAHLPESQMQKPVICYEEHIAKPIKDGIITETLFVFTQYEHVSLFRADAYISRLHIPFISPQREYVSFTEIHSRSVSGLNLLYRAVHDHISTAFAYSERLGLALVGFDTGAIHGFLRRDAQPALKLESHRATVRGIALVGASSAISVGDDRKLLLWDLSARAVVSSLALQDRPLQLQMDGEQVFVALPKIVASLKLNDLQPEWEAILADLTETEFVISAICISSGAALIGTESGVLLIYDLARRQETGKLVWTGKITRIVASPRRKEVILANEKGKVATFSLESGTLLNVFSGDYHTVTYLGWDEGSDQLFVSGEERKLRVYRMPVSWHLIVAEALTDTVDESQRKALEDNLAGWDR